MVGLLIAVFACAGSIATAIYAITKIKRGYSTDLREENENLRSRLKECKAEMDFVQGEIKKMKQEIFELHQELYELRRSER